MPNNHASSIENPSAVLKHIDSEVRAGRYTGPLHPERLEMLINSPFRTAPLGVIPKPGTSEFRIIQDLSYPRDSNIHFSVNSEIEPDLYICEWGTFPLVVTMIMDAAPGTQAATLDVDAAYRRVPITPEQQKHFIVAWNGLCWIDHNAPFGGASSGVVFGHIADAMKAIYLAHGVDALTKWVDDFLFLRYNTTKDASKPSYRYDLDLIYKVAADLGWPWKPSKTRPFASTFKYLGFEWDLEEKSVQIPGDKRTKYIEKMATWTKDRKQKRKDAESLLGTLVHCAMAIPDGRSRIAAIARFMASFERAKAPRFASREPSAEVIDDIIWWRSELDVTKPFCGSLLFRPPAPSTTEFWVDASTSWGIGVVFDGAWESWILKDDWKQDGRDIGWAEMVAIELGLEMAIANGFADHHFVIRSDNQGVIHALDNGRSRNSQQNRVLRRIVLLMRIHSLWFTSEYVPSKENIADKPSRGIPPPGFPRSTVSIAVHADLRHILRVADIEIVPHDV